MPALAAARAGTPEDAAVCGSAAGVEPSDSDALVAIAWGAETEAGVALTLASAPALALPLPLALALPGTIAGDADAGMACDSATDVGGEAPPFVHT